MGSAPDKTYESNEMNQNHIDHRTMVGYQYHGRQIISNFNNGYYMEQPMQEQRQMHYYQNYAATPENPVTIDYYTPTQGEHHQINENMGVQSFNDQSQKQSANPPNFHTTNRSAIQQTNSDYRFIPSQLRQRTNNQWLGSPGFARSRQVLYSPSLNSSSGYSSNPSSNSNSSNPSSVNMQQNPQQIYENNSFASPRMMNTNVANQAFSSESQKGVNYGNEQQQYVSQEPVFHVLENVAKTAEMPSSSRKRVSTGSDPMDGMKKKVGAPPKHVCKDHPNGEDKSCAECKKLKEEAHNRDVKKNKTKTKRLYQQLENQIPDLKFCFNCFKEVLIDLQCFNQHMLDKDAHEYIEAVVVEPEDVESPPTEKELAAMEEQKQAVTKKEKGLAALHLNRAKDSKAEEEVPAKHDQLLKRTVDLARAVQWAKNAVKNPGANNNMQQ
uniref:Uncharacterized protein n=1 Tax=Panagrolaimus davidi TaxID=227884 RepID=A0A914QJR6_9BILA